VLTVRAKKEDLFFGEDWDSRISDGIYILCVTRNPRSSEKKIRQTMGI